MENPSLSFLFEDKSVFQLSQDLYEETSNTDWKETILKYCEDADDCHWDPCKLNALLHIVCFSPCKRSKDLVQKFVDVHSED